MNTLKEKLSSTRTLIDTFLVKFYPRLNVSTVDLVHKRALVTGANVGLGKAIAISLASQGAEVHLICRSKSKASTTKDEIAEQTGNTNIFVHVVDFSSLQSVATFVDSWRSRAKADRKIDILINNAGLTIGSKSTSPDGFELTYAVNMLGQFALTIPLLQYGCFSSSARIIQVSSGAMYQGQQGSLNPTDLNSTDMLDPIPEGGELLFSQMYHLYERSKALQVVFTIELQERLRADARYNDVVLHSCHPGTVNTTIWYRPHGAAFNAANGEWASFIGSTFGISSEEGAITPVWLATSPEAGRPEARARFWERNRWKWIPAWMHDKRQRTAIWDLMAKDAMMEGIY